MNNEEKLKALLTLPLFQKMIEVATKKAELDPTYLENLDLNELKEDAQNSFFSKMIEFKKNKADMDLLAKKVYIKIHLDNLVSKL